MPTTLEGLLGSLGENHTVQLTVQAGTDAATLLSGVVLGVTKVLGLSGTVDYTVVIRTGQQQLDDAAASFNSTIDLINQERKRQGKPPLGSPDAGSRGVDIEWPVEQAPVAQSCVEQLAEEG